MWILKDLLLDLHLWIKKNNKVISIRYKGNSLAKLIPQLVNKAKSIVKDLDTQNDLKFIRLKTAKN